MKQRDLTAVSKNHEASLCVSLALQHRLTMTRTLQIFFSDVATVINVTSDVAFQYSVDSFMLYIFSLSYDFRTMRKSFNCVSMIFLSTDSASSCLICFLMSYLFLNSFNHSVENLSFSMLSYCDNLFQNFDVIFCRIFSVIATSLRCIRCCQSNKVIFKSE